VEDILYLNMVIYIGLIATMANLLRFRGGITFNRWMIVLASGLIVGLEGIVYNFQHTTWMLFLVIGFSAISFRILGGVISAILSFMTHWLITNNHDLFFLVCYLIFAVTVTIIAHYIRTVKKERDQWLTNLIGNSKQLNVFKEVSVAMQQTLDIQRLLQTIRIIIMFKIIDIH